MRKKLFTKLRTDFQNASSIEAKEECLLTWLNHCTTEIQIEKLWDFCEYDRDDLSDHAIKAVYDKWINLFRTLKVIKYAYDTVPTSQIPCEENGIHAPRYNLEKIDQKWNEIALKKAIMAKTFDEAFYVNQHCPFYSWKPVEISYKKCRDFNPGLPEYKLRHPHY